MSAALAARFARQRDPALRDALFASKAAVVAAAAADGAHTLIALDASNTVRLVGFAFADFDESDVLLH